MNAACDVGAKEREDRKFHKEATPNNVQVVSTCSLQPGTPTGSWSQKEVYLTSLKCSDIYLTNVHTHTHTKHEIENVAI